MKKKNISANNIYSFILNDLLDASDLHSSSFVKDCHIFSNRFKVMDPTARYIDIPLLLDFFSYGEPVTQMCAFMDTIINIHIANAADLGKDISAALIYTEKGTMIENMPRRLISSMNRVALTMSCAYDAYPLCMILLLFVVNMFIEFIESIESIIFIWAIEYFIIIYGTVKAGYIVNERGCVRDI